MARERSIVVPVVGTHLQRRQQRTPQCRYAPQMSVLGVYAEPTVVIIE
jgi:hypothetical protein